MRYWIWVLGLFLCAMGCSEELMIEKGGTDLGEAGTETGVDTYIQVVDWDLRLDFQVPIAADAGGIEAGPDQNVDVITPDAQVPDVQQPPDVQVPDNRVPDVQPPDQSPPDTRPSHLPPLKTMSIGITPFGSKLGEPGRTADEIAQITISINYKYDLGIYEVSQQEWLAIMGTAPAGTVYNCPNCPAFGMDLGEVRDYCNALSVLEGLEPYYPGIGPYPIIGQPGFYGYRLPTESEWEAAYRVRLASSTYIGDIVDPDIDPLATAIGWYWYKTYTDIYKARDLQPRGLKQPNIWGLYDMAGNVNEFTIGGGNQFICKGGNVGSPASELRAGWRRQCWGDNVTGFRIARYLEP